jgi:hypothetical protein
MRHLLIQRNSRLKATLEARSWLPTG